MLTLRPVCFRTFMSGHKAREHILYREVNRLRNEVEKLEKLRKELCSDGQLLTVEEYIQKLDARYDSRFRKLENNWLILD